VFVSLASRCRFPDTDLILAATRPSGRSPQETAPSSPSSPRQHPNLAYGAPQLLPGQNSPRDPIAQLDPVIAGTHQNHSIWRHLFAPEPPAAPAAPRRRSQAPRTQPRGCAPDCWSHQSRATATVVSDSSQNFSFTNLPPPQPPLYRRVLQNEQTLSVSTENRVMAMMSGRLVGLTSANRTMDLGRAGSARS
jgi:hypothetical protein